MKYLFDKLSDVMLLLASAMVVITHALVGESEKEQQQPSGSTKDVYYNMLNAGLIMIDAEHVIVHINKCAADMFKYAVDDLIGQSLLKLIPERFKEKHIENMKQWICSGCQSLPPVTVTGLDANNREFDVTIRIMPSTFRGKMAYISYIY